MGMRMPQGVPSKEEDVGYEIELLLERGQKALEDVEFGGFDIIANELERYMALANTQETDEFRVPDDLLEKAKEMHDKMREQVMGNSKKH